MPQLSGKPLPRIDDDTTPLWKTLVPLTFVTLTVTYFTVSMLIYHFHGPSAAQARLMAPVATAGVPHVFTREQIANHPARALSHVGALTSAPNRGSQRRGSNDPYAATRGQSPTGVNRSSAGRYAEGAPQATDSLALLSQMAIASASDPADLVVMPAGATSNAQTSSNTRQPPPVTEFGAPAGAHLDYKISPVATLSEQSGNYESEIQQLLVQAESLFRADALTTPPGDNALDRWRQALQIDPQHPMAHGGIQRIVDQYLDWGAQAERAGQYESARIFYERAEVAAPSADEVALRLTLLRDRERRLSSR